MKECGQRASGVTHLSSRLFCLIVGVKKKNPTETKLACFSYLSTGIVQGARGLMLASVLLSFISVLVEMVGMRCTTFMAAEPEQKDKVALAGGVIFIIAG